MLIVVERDRTGNGADRNASFRMAKEYASAGADRRSGRRQLQLPFLIGLLLYCWHRAHAQNGGRVKLVLDDLRKRLMSHDTPISIVPYREEFDTQIVGLILHIQNVEAKVGISAQDQPDILSIRHSYCDGHGGFWVALLDNREVVGTIGLQRVAATVGVLKKFFVHSAYRGMKAGPAAGLYSALLLHAEATGVRTLLLDTPAVATRSHAFYKRAGFIRIEKADLPVVYDYPDRSSLLFRLDLPERQ
jgi:N-acetylglutamate synthase-like GNAT family acetyltransferase